MSCFMKILLPRKRMSNNVFIYNTRVFQSVVWTYPREFRANESECWGREKLASIVIYAVIVSPFPWPPRPTKCKIKEAGTVHPNADAILRVLRIHPTLFNHVLDERCCTVQP